MAQNVNPYIAGSPVTGTEMFFGRQDVFAFVRQALIGKHQDNALVLYGQRRTGKTTVLYQMSRHLDDAYYLCIFIDLHGLALAGLSSFLWELANHIVRGLRRDYQIVGPPLDRAEFTADARAAFENFLSQLWPRMGDRHLLLMLDEAIRLQEQVQVGKMEHDVFEYLRHLMQHYRQLNFLFSLGSGLEEMEREYAFLFSVSLYKKISFLDREAATALIIEPVKDCFQVEPAAVERILGITSGHAYYTQLVCHSLFNRWQRDPVPSIGAEDVDAVLDEVVERGLAVLKHVWEEAKPREKAILAGLAAAMGGRNRAVTVRDVERAWTKYEVTIPAEEVVGATQGLIAREIIVGKDRYTFAVDLQRLWVQRYARLEWVKGEIADEVKRWQDLSRSKVAPSPFWSPKRPWTLTSLGLAAMLIIAALAYALSQARPVAQPVSQTTAPAVLTLEALIAELTSAVNGETATALQAKLNSAETTVSALEALVTRTPATPTPTVTPCGPPFGWLLYVVQRGDTLYSLARVTGTTLAQLRSANCIEGDQIYTGQLLYVPRLPVTDTPSPTSVPHTLTPRPSASPAATSLPSPSPIVVLTRTINLLTYAPSAAWSNSAGASGLWLAAYPEAESTVAQRGFGVFAPSDRLLETGSVVGERLVLMTHPPSVGELRGSFWLTIPPQGARFFATLAFLAGAAPESDGAHVEVWWYSDVFPSGTKIAEADAGDNGSETNLSDGDQVMSSFGGQSGKLDLVISGWANNAKDWLTWTALEVSPK